MVHGTKGDREDKVLARRLMRHLLKMQTDSGVEAVSEFDLPGRAYYTGWDVW